jgi:hypothetical protein
MHAQAISPLEELALVGQRLAKLDAYGVRVAVTFSYADDGAVGQAMRIEAWRDGEQFAYRSGPVEVLWLTRGVIVVNHASRTIVLRQPVRQDEGLAQLAAQLSYEHLTSNAVVSGVSISEETRGRRFIVPHARGPLLRAELLLDAESQLPSSALLIYRSGFRVPRQVAIAYEWNIGKPSASILDHRRVLIWEEDDAVVIQPAFSQYKLVRLDQVR